MDKRLRKALVVLFCFASIHVIVVSTGHRYLYTTLQNTIFKGRLGPDIDEYQIFPSRVVEADTFHDLPFHASFGTFKLTDAEQNSVDELQPVALLILKKDSILFERYWENYSSDSKSNSFSAAKSIVNIAIGVAIREGKIDGLNQKVGDFLPEFASGANAELSIKHLLMMSSGIDFDEDYLNPFAFPARANYGTDLKGLVKKYTVTETPAQRFEYRSGNTQLLAFIIEKATGMTLSEYFSKRVWSRIGSKNEALWSLDTENGSEKAFCCFNSNARDFSRIGLLYLHSGELNGVRIVDSSFVKASVSPQNIVENDGSECVRYGLHWWLHDFNGERIFYARGILGQYIIVIPSMDIVIVRLGHKRIKPEGTDAPGDLALYLNIANRMNSEL